MRYLKIDASLRDQAPLTIAKIIAMVSPYFLFLYLTNLDQRLKRTVPNYSSLRMAGQSVKFWVSIFVIIVPMQRKSWGMSEMHQ
jgi:hypothetical protein